MERDIKLNNYTDILYSKFNYIKALQSEKRLEGSTTPKLLQNNHSQMLHVT